MTEPEDEEVTLDDIRETADLDETADEVGVEREYLDEHIEAHAADKRYKESQPKPKSLRERVGDGLHKIRRVFLPPNELPRTGVVDDIGTENDYITLTLTDDDAENVVRLAPDGRTIDQLIKHVGGSKPSDLLDETIPVKPVGGDRTCIIPHVPRNRGVMLLPYLWKRFLMRAGAYSVGNNKNVGTRTFLLLNGLGMLLLTQLATALLPAAALTATLLQEANGSQAVSIGEALLAVGISPLLLYGIIVSLSLLGVLINTLFR